MALRKKRLLAWLLCLVLLLSLVPAAFAQETEEPAPAAESTEPAGEPQPAEESGEEEPREPAPEETPAPQTPAPQPEETPAPEKEEAEQIIDLDEEKLTEEEAAVCREVEEFLRAKMDMHSAVVAAVLANIHRESCFNPTLEGDDGTAYGLFQWHGIRLERLMEYCRKHRLEYDSVKGQMFFFRYEVQTYYSGLYKHVLRDCINSEKGALEATYYLCEIYEAPGDLEQNLRERCALTELIYWPMTQGEIELPVFETPAAPAVEASAEAPAETAAEAPAEVPAETVAEAPAEAAA